MIDHLTATPYGSVELFTAGAQVTEDGHEVEISFTMKLITAHLMWSFQLAVRSDLFDAKGTMQTLTWFVNTEDELPDDDDEAVGATALGNKPEEKHVPLFSVLAPRLDLLKLSMAEKHEFILDFFLNHFTPHCVQDGEVLIDAYVGMCLEIEKVAESEMMHVQPRLAGVVKILALVRTACACLKDLPEAKHFQALKEAIKNNESADAKLFPTSDLLLAFGLNTVYKTNMIHAI